MFWATDLNSFGTDISDLYDGDGRLLFINDTKPATKIVFERGVTFDEVKAQLAEVDGYSVGRGAFACAPNAICDTEIQAIVNATNAPNAAETDGVIAKLTLSYRTDSDVLIYGTYSEGFRPGLLNRPGGAAKGEYIVPFAVDSDDVTNIEIGWKADLLDGSMRFNGNVFFVDVEKMQTTMFDPGITNLFFSDNAANAEVKGLEADLLWAPNSVDGLTISAAVSFLDTEVTDVLLPSNDVRAGDELAYAPEFQGNLQARYEWDLASGLLAHVMPHMATSSKSYSDIIRMNRDEIGSWTMLGISAGVSSDTWSAELYVDNLTDERAEIARNFVFDRQRVTYARPRTVGARFIMNF